MPRYACDEDLRGKVLGTTGVGTVLSGRLYADAAPQKPTFPYGTLTLIGDAARSERLNGDPLKTIRARYQLDFYAETKAQARDLAARVSARMTDGGFDGFRGTMGATFVQACRIENRRDEYWDSESAGEARVYQASFDVVIVFNE